MNNNLTLIEVDKIYQHPDNPRKDLGDLSELTESIRKNGLMQNLTVIPGHYKNGKWYDDCYTLIIGHRRCAAAKAAGLKNVPCRIVDMMDKREQISTMLEENMQRNDLTVVEQAQGFQLMLDLGETESSISEKTGFSKSTVHRRLELAKLNQKELEKKTNSKGGIQLSITDLYGLSEIKDVKVRNKVLKDAANSRDLAWKIKLAVREEIRAEHLKKFVEIFNNAGVKKAPKEIEQEKYSGKWDIVLEYDLDKNVPKKIDLKDENLLWVVFYGNTVSVIRPRKKVEKTFSEWELKEKERKKRRKELKQKCDQMYEKMRLFIISILDGEIKPLKEDVSLYKELINVIIKAGLTGSRSQLAFFRTGKKLYDLKKNTELYEDFIKWEEDLSALHIALATMNQIRDYELYNYNGEYDNDRANKVMVVLEFLFKYGFSVSEEEKQILDGSHTLYRKREK